MQRAACLIAVLLAAMRVSAQEESLIDLYSETEKPVRAAPVAPGATPDFLLPTEVEFEVQGVARAKGKIVIVLFDNAVAFGSMGGTDAVGFAEVPAEKGTVRTTLQAIGDPPYAAFVYHDQNDDRQLNIDRGVPTEGYGYSGSVDPYRPPRYEQAAIIEHRGSVRLTYIPRHPGR